MVPLSIIIPTHNRAALVDKTLHSLTLQSCTNFHVLVIDHASTDSTATVARRYQTRLPLTYKRIERTKYSPGEPRDAGVSLAETPLIAFLDSGTVVPVCYVEAHLAFHNTHEQTVGIGMQYRKDDDNDQDDQPDDETLERAYKLLSEGSAQQLTGGHAGLSAFFKNARLEDQRECIDLSASPIPWYFGWTANLSLPRAAYVAAGGFDSELEGWGFEDLDLCYRLFQHGLHFAFVRAGWSLELLHTRQSTQERMETSQRNMRRGYFKQRGLALEALLLAGTLLRKAMEAFRADPATRPEVIVALRGQMLAYFQLQHFSQQISKILAYLTMLGQICTTLPPLSARARAQVQQPALLVGGTREQAEEYTAVTLADDTHLSTATLWSCCGILLPQSDQSLETVVVSDIWKWLGWTPPYAFAFALPRVTLLEVLVSEIRRVARQAIFLHSPAISPAPSGVSVEELTRLCLKYELPFQLEILK